MRRSETVIEGTLKPDGTLELDEKPNLAPGRVTIVLRQESEPTSAKEGWWPYMQRVRAEREATGYPFLNEAEMADRLLWLRDDEERLDHIYREMDEERRRREQP
jgi:hypothetical protein